MDVTLAAIAGSQKVCATLGGRGRTGWGESWVGMLFSHECLEAYTLISDGND